MIRKFHFVTSFSPNCLKVNTRRYITKLLSTPKIHSNDFGHVSFYTHHQRNKNGALEYNLGCIKLKRFEIKCLFTSFTYS